MSYDVSLRLPTGAGNFAEIDVRNVTWNNAPIFAKAFNDAKFSLGHLSGKIAKDVRPFIQLALCEILADPDSFKEAAKKAGAQNWGGLEDAKDFLEKLLAACETHPDMEIHIS